LLTDEDGSYTADEAFGLTELVETLERTSSLFGGFSVTKAHRDKAGPGNSWPADADIQEFRFDNPSHFSPENYDEIWLIGVRRTSPNPMSP